MHINPRNEPSSRKGLSKHHGAAPHILLSPPKSARETRSVDLQPNPFNYQESFQSSNPLPAFDSVFHVSRLLSPVELCKPQNDQPPLFNLDEDPKEGQMNHSHLDNSIIKARFEHDSERKSMFLSPEHLVREKHNNLWLELPINQKVTPKKQEVTQKIASDGEASENSDSACCTCQKSRCFRLYCKCFQERKHCGSKCKCKNCFNVAENQDLIELLVKELLSKNPKSFESKIKKLKSKGSVVHTRGCNCRRTGCNKKYCECYNAGISCSQLCKCRKCENSKEDIAEEDKVELNQILKKKIQKQNMFANLVEKIQKIKSLANIPQDLLDE